MQALVAGCEQLSLHAFLLHSDTGVEAHKFEALSVQPLLQLNVRTAFAATNNGLPCFELLAYDVLLDDKCNVWLLEVTCRAC